MAGIGDRLLSALVSAPGLGAATGATAGFLLSDRRNRLRNTALGAVGGGAAGYGVHRLLNPPAAAPEEAPAAAPAPAQEEVPAVAVKPADLPGKATTSADLLNMYADRYKDDPASLRALKAVAARSFHLNGGRVRMNNTNRPMQEAYAREMKHVMEEQPWMYADYGDPRPVVSLVARILKHGPDAPVKKSVKAAANGGYRPPSNVMTGHQNAGK